MNKEEDGGFSLVVLALSIALYITITCMTFAGMVVTRPSVGAALLDFAKDYGALIAGIPVLIAVLVAKQQLDASRRQHVATVKRSFQRELDTLDRLAEFSKNAQTANHQSALITGMNYGIGGLIIERPEDQELKAIEQLMPYAIYSLARDISAEITELFHQSRKDSPDKEVIGIMLDSICIKSSILAYKIELEKKHLSQYWS